MSREALDSFSDRIIRCGEVSEFLNILMDKGVSPGQILNVVNKRLYPFDKKEVHKEGEER
jgi:hypothetical protein